MKPGPAISTLSIRSVDGKLATIIAARSRGLFRAGLARRIATFVAKSPWLPSRVRSTVPETARSATAAASSGTFVRASLTNFVTRDFISEPAILPVYVPLRRRVARIIHELSGLEQFYWIDIDRPAHSAGGGFDFERDAQILECGMQ